MGWAAGFYKNFGRRFSTLFLFSVGGAIFLDAYVCLKFIQKIIWFVDFQLNRLSEFIWDTHNKGKQWKDIKHNYVQQAEVEEE